MSWAEEDWTAGLSGRVLQKVKELQVHHERLSRENKQKQLQLDNIHISHDKQTIKYEEVRGELHAVRRELQSVREEAQVAVNGGQRLSQELQTKQAQVCSLEGQLDAARTLNNKLTQEMKRLEAELEKVQNGSRSADNTLFSTPCWSTSSPWEHHGSRKDERTAQNEESQNSPPIRLRLQFPDAPSASSPRQLKTTPHGHPSDQSDSFATPLAVFPWERNDPSPAARRASPSSPQTPAADRQSKREAPEREKDLSTQTDTSLSQMRRHAASLEEELSVKTETLKSLQDEVTQSKKKMAATELSLQRAHNELSVATTRISQESERASGAEQRLKQLQEELKCQRQNAESSRLQHQQRTKELDKQHQRDLLELQKEKQYMERGHQQEINRVNQELQQARTLHNALQAQADKLSQQKQTLEKELESLKEKVKFTEGQLQESQKTENQIQAKLKEVTLDAEGVAVSLEQSKKRERTLEDEASRLAEERADALRLLKELQEKAAPLPDCTPLVPACPVGQSFPSQPSSHHTRSSTYTKRPSAPRAELRGLKQEDGVQERAEISVSYPPDREPGEGIDSEHIAADTECSHRGINYEEKESSPSNNPPADGESDIVILDSLKSEQTIRTDDLQRENASLHSELRDVREELQKRLDDLEVQRRAEVEARTRLKQLSRKHASQGAERAEQDTKWKSQLEKEMSENDRLRKALAALEEREEEQDGTKQAQEDREMEMMQLNLKLKQQLGDVKVQLALEREGREREKEELAQIATAEREGKRELSLRLEELATQISELKNVRGEDSIRDEKMVANSPLTYLTLHSDTLNSNLAVSDNRVPSPEQYAHFCQSTNQLNTLVSRKHLQRSQKGQTVPMVCDLHKDESVSSDLTKEFERLRGENAQETERANLLQIKLAALQNQLTSQTKQLSAGFEKQSQYISGLLAELQEKDGALLSQGEELRRCVQELDTLKHETTGESEGARNKKDKISKGENEGQMGDAASSFEPQSNHETHFPVTSSPNEADNVLIQPRDFEGSDWTESINGCAVVNIEAVCGPDKGQALADVPPLARQHEDQVVKQSSETCILSDTSNLLPKQSSGCDVLSTTPGVSYYVTSEMGRSHDEIINYLQTQVVALQRDLQKLTEVSQQQAGELAIWRLASQPSSALDQVLPSQAQHGAKDQSAALVIREDEVLLSCATNRLQGRMLATSMQQNNMPEINVHQHSSDMNTEVQLSGPCLTPHKVSRHQTAPEHIGNDSAQTSDGDSSSWTATKRLSIISTNSSATSVGTQTERQRCPAGTETVTERHCVHTQTHTEMEEEDLADATPHVAQAAQSVGRETSDKMLFSTSFPIPADPVRLAERIRRNRTQLSAAFDDTEYEPYGLPEVVMKGFADIPTGPSCPYIVRRGLLGTAVVPVTQKVANPEDETD
ncbi:uncharacterized protein LOC144026079 [Festucalex cinctus]